jgi:UDP-N-acetylglucosamine transferase subunit ALG13
MIFVTVGMSTSPFDRLLRAVGELPLEEELVVQHGPSLVRPARARCHDYLPHDELTELMRQARVVVTHAGVGSVALALLQGKRPVVVPRRRRFGEAVDDHQAQLAGTLHRQGVVRLVDDLDELRAVIEDPQGHESAAMQQGQSLASDLRDYLRLVVDETRPER